MKLTLHSLETNQQVLIEASKVSARHKASANAESLEIEATLQHDQWQSLQAFVEQNHTHQNYLVILDALETYQGFTLQTWHRSTRYEASAPLHDVVLCLDTAPCLNKQSPPRNTPSHAYLAHNESLSALAGRIWGQPELWTLLARANKINDPFALKAGQKITIPPTNSKPDAS